MKLLFRVLLTINATSWMLVVYVIKEGITVWNVPQAMFGLLMLCIPLVLSFVSIGITSCFGADSIEECQEYGLADNEFLATYLGYFFVSLSVTDVTTMIYMYSIVFIFTFVSQTQYFNPVFLLFGYHYYHILTKHGTKVFVIAKGKVIRNKDEIIFKNLRRINDTTYIQRKEK